MQKGFRFLKRSLSLALACALCLLTFACGKPMSVIEVKTGGWSNNSFALPFGSSSAQTNTDGTWVFFRSSKTLQEMAEEITEEYANDFYITSSAHGYLINQKLDPTDVATLLDCYFLGQIPNSKKMKEGKTKDYVFTSLVRKIDVGSGQTQQILFPAHLLRDPALRGGDASIPLDTKLQILGTSIDIGLFYEAFGRYNVHLIDDEWVITGYAALPADVDPLQAPLFSRRVMLRVEGASDFATITVSLREGKYKDLQTTTVAAQSS
ncbi:MAG: hypothetical protein LBB67_00440 [Oscillospiraceae bacterium]|jgi:hypothetical protein|nr:hypothetical protein [Oscillospiraceae bacterium]